MIKWRVFSIRTRGMHSLAKKRPGIIIINIIIQLALVYLRMIPLPLFVAWISFHLTKSDLLAVASLLACLSSQ